MPTQPKIHRNSSRDGGVGRPADMPWAMIQRQATSPTTRRPTRTRPGPRRRRARVRAARRGCRAQDEQERQGDGRSPRPRGRPRAAAGSGRPGDSRGRGPRPGAPSIIAAAASRPTTRAATPARARRLTGSGPAAPPQDVRADARDDQRARARIGRRTSVPVPGTRCCRCRATADGDGAALADGRRRSDGATVGAADGSRARFGARRVGGLGRRSRSARGSARARDREVDSVPRSR